MRELRRSRFAESDMRQAGAGARYLQAAASTLNADVVRVLETGLSVTYARPFAEGNKAGTIAGKYARPEAEPLRPLHDGILARRDDLYAHNDDADPPRTSFRSSVDPHPCSTPKRKKRPRGDGARIGQHSLSRRAFTRRAARLSTR
jgi:hypothetical protein